MSARMPRNKSAGKQAIPARVPYHDDELPPF